jgi:L-fucose mutarotase/ribose pyranase (RbsD/FucU family)
MNTMRYSLLLILAAAAHGQTWQQKVADKIPLYGHRNWIVIADSAYPAQSRDGIETIISDEDQVTVLRRVLLMLDRTKHVRPIAYTDAELKFVQDDDAPGVEAYRAKLEDLLHNRPVNTLEHEKIIARLDEAGQTFRVLIIKTNMTIPYTSVFLQLDCAYWGPENEKKLRAAMSK